MNKTPFAIAVDEIQKQLRPYLKEVGFRVKGRTFNRTTEDALVQVINLQMGAFNPPGTVYEPGFRENLHGLFTINLGVYVPEIDPYAAPGKTKKWVLERSCCIHSRLGYASGEKADIWWPARNEKVLLNELLDRLKNGGMPFLEKHSTRDKILDNLKGRQEDFGIGGPPRITCAKILHARGELKEAEKLLCDQIRNAEETNNPGHAKYVRELAKNMGFAIQ